MIPFSQKIELSCKSFSLQCNFNAKYICYRRECQRAVCIGRKSQFAYSELSLKMCFGIMNATIFIKIYVCVGRVIKIATFMECLYTRHMAHIILIFRLVLSFQMRNLKLRSLSDLSRFKLKRNFLLFKLAQAIHKETLLSSQAKKSVFGR